MTIAEATIARDVALYGSARLFRGDRVRVRASLADLLFVESVWRGGEWVPVGRYITRDEVEESP